MIDAETTIEVLRRAAQTLRSVSASTTDELRAIAEARNALDAAEVSRLAVLQQTREHEDEGSSSIPTWGKVALRQDSRLTRAMLKADATLATLPALAEQVGQGRVSLEHVRAFTFGLAHIGTDVMVAAEDWLLQLALTCEPELLMEAIRKLRLAVFPDELDEAWAKGMAKKDLKLARTIGGWAVTGFLDIETGAKLKAVLDSLSAPRDADDDRDGAERRVQGLDELLSRILDSGTLPADNGVKPHLSVIVDAEVLRDALGRALPEPPATLPGVADMALAPAHLVGFGPIGPQLLAHLTCQGDLTPILVDSFARNSRILDVGRSSRLARLPQRRAVHARQAGTCATPGCSHPIRHIHHATWWSRGGTTDIDHLVGLCSGCHHLVHAEKLHITSETDGAFTFTNSRGHPLRGRDDLRTVKTLSRILRPPRAA